MGHKHHHPLSQVIKLDHGMALGWGYRSLTWSLAHVRGLDSALRYHLCDVMACLWQLSFHWEYAYHSRRGMLLAYVTCSTHDLHGISQVKGQFQYSCRRVQNSKPWREHQFCLEDAHRNKTTGIQSHWPPGNHAFFTAPLHQVSGIKVKCLWKFACKVFPFQVHC